MGPTAPTLALPAPLILGIAPQSAHILSALFATGYVGSIYLSNLFSGPTPEPAPDKSARSPRSQVLEASGASPAIPPIAATDADGEVLLDAKSPRPGDRDHPATIRRRMTAVGLATAASMVGLWGVVKQAGGYTASGAVHPTLTLLSIPTTIPPLNTSFNTVLPYALAPTLLLGPLLAMALDGSLPLQGARGSAWTRVKGVFADWGLVEMRNYVVGPLTEELTFRSAILAVSLLAKFRLSTLVFATPLWFGVAHAHHAYEGFKKGGGTKDAAVQAVAQSAFQLTYTTLFGWFAAYLFLRTGSVVPPLAAHVYCNLIGIYLPTTAVARHPQRRIVIWSAYIFGVSGFIFGLRKL